MKMSDSGEASTEGPGVVGIGSGQVRKIHVVYFLSRNGRTEQPHLIHVHQQQQCRGGVRLRDVKRWLSYLRGKDMPAAFAWSYKRRYKAGYVWQDLMTDDDLITPVADNEYLLKGSSTSFCADSPATAASTGLSLAPMVRCIHCSSTDPRSSLDAEESAGAPITISRPPDTNSMESPSEIIEGNDDVDGTKCNRPTKPPLPGEDDYVTRSPSSTSSSLSLAASSIITTCSAVSDSSTQTPATPSPKRVFKFDVVASDDEGKTTEYRDEAPLGHGCRAVGSSLETGVALLPCRFRKSRSCPGKGGGGGPAQMFRSLLTCGSAVDVNDSVMLPVGRRWHRSGSAPRTSFSGSSSRSASGKTGSGEKHGRPSSAPSAAYRPAAAPNCSQCGRPFRPEKLCSHMRSCKAVKQLRTRKRLYHYQVQGGCLP